MTPQEAEVLFSQRIDEALRLCHELGYHPNRFQQMFNKYGAANTARRLVASGDLQDGLRRLSRMGRLDLSMEQIMLEDPFHLIFTQQELAAAQWRLDQL